MNADHQYVELALCSGALKTTPLFFPCPNCAKGVPFSISIQKRLLQGGVGHQCPHCDQYNAIVVGSCCSQLFAIDDISWDQLARGEPINCPNCSSLLRLPTRPGITLGTSFREVPTLRSCSGHSTELAFVDAAKKSLLEANQDLLAIYHQTTQERLALAREYLEILKNSVLTSSFAIFNTPNLDEAVPEGQLKSSELLPNLVFQISSALFSAIESLAQEMNVVIGNPWSERNVAYGSFEKIPEAHADLNSRCREFISRPGFTFLLNLRNLSLHRRITTLATEARYTLPGHGPIRPGSVSADCIHYLPDNPIVVPGKETFESKLEVKKTLQQLADEIEEFTFSLYGLLAEHLSR